MSLIKKHPWLVVAGALIAWQLYADFQRAKTGAQGALSPSLFTTLN